MKALAIGLPLIFLFTCCKKDHHNPDPPPTDTVVVTKPPVNKDSITAKWTVLTDLDSAIYGAVSYSVGGKGYVLTGSNLHYSYDVFSSNPTVYYGGPTAGFIRYDTTTKAWERLPDFPGGVRIGGVGFSIGNKIYFGTGTSDRASSDFWQFDTGTNAWTKLADFPGGARTNAAAFAIGDKGYIISGTDTYEFSSSDNSWKKMANFPGVGRDNATGIALGSAGYYGMGDGNFLDFWQFTPATNTWTRKANIIAFAPADYGPTGPADSVYGTSGATGFALKNKLFVACGYRPDAYAPNDHYYSDVWEYDPSTDHWFAMPGRSVRGRTLSFSFVIGDQAFLGGGYWTQYKASHAADIGVQKDLYKFSF